MSADSARGAQGTAKRWRQITAPFRMLPDFVIPGEAKCGTTSLYRYLCREPSILAANMKEPNNFWRFGASPLWCRQHYPLRMTKWVRKWKGMRTLTGDASPEYFSKPSVATSVRELCPDIPLIFLFRDPIERAWSDHHMLTRAGVEKLPFAARVRESLRWYGDPSMSEVLAKLGELEHHPARYIGRGRYRANLQPWLREFHRDRMLFLCSESFFENPEGEVNRVLQFLGLPKTKQTDWPVYKKGREKAEMDPAIREELEAFFAPSNQSLFEFLGEEWPWRV